MPTNNNTTENHQISYSSLKSRDTLLSKHLSLTTNDKCLDFNADQLATDEWKQLLASLKTHRSLQLISIKSEYQDKQLKNSKEKPAVYNTGILNSLSETLSIFMRNSKTLVTLDLQSLPFNRTHMIVISNGIKECKNLKNLKLTNFRLCDNGLQVLYDSVHPHLKLVCIDFTGCSLTCHGAKVIAKIIHNQRVARVDKTWKNSYDQESKSGFPRIRQITLNNNPEIGDDGFKMICYELLDDLWIKAIDMQNCGLSATSANEALELLNVNQTISILNLNENEKIPNDVHSTLQIILSQRAQHKNSHVKGRLCETSISNSTGVGGTEGYANKLNTNKIANPITAIISNCKLIKNKFSNSSVSSTDVQEYRKVIKNTKSILLKDKVKLKMEKQKLKDLSSSRYKNEPVENKCLKNERETFKEKIKTTDLQCCQRRYSDNNVQPYHKYAHSTLLTNKLQYKKIKSESFKIKTESFDKQYERYNKTGDKNKKHAILNIANIKNRNCNEKIANIRGGNKDCIIDRNDEKCKLLKYPKTSEPRPKILQNQVDYDKRYTSKHRIKIEKKDDSKCDKTVTNKKLIGANPTGRYTVKKISKNQISNNEAKINCNRKDFIKNMPVRNTRPKKFLTDKEKVSYNSHNSDNKIDKHTIPSSNTNYNKQQKHCKSCPKKNETNTTNTRKHVQ